MKTKNVKWQFKSLPHEIDLKAILSLRYQSKRQLERAVIRCRAVLVHLGYRADEKGECWPNYNTIAAYTGLGKSTVSAAIKDLAAVGLLVVSAGTGGNRNPQRAVNHYHLQLGALHSAFKLEIKADDRASEKIAVESQVTVVESQLPSVESQVGFVESQNRGLSSPTCGTVTKKEPDIMEPDTLEPDSIEPLSQKTDDLLETNTHEPPSSPQEPVEDNLASSLTVGLDKNHPDEPTTNEQLQARIRDLTQMRDKWAETLQFYKRSGKDAGIATAQRMIASKESQIAQLTAQLTAQYAAQEEIYEPTRH